MTDNELQRVIQDALSGPWIRNARRVDSRTVVVEADSDGFSFDNMCVLSEMFGTRKIDAGSERRSGGYCETCAYSYSVSTLCISEITTWPKVGSDDE
ncbi:MAG: hypothetical protein ACTHU0_22135 [Kofleriaceae bacterium]